MWRDVFNTFDRDGSGKLSSAEIGMILKSSNYDKATLENWLRTHNKSNSNEMDYDDFLNFVKNQK